MINNSSPNYSCRCVYTGSKVLSLFNSNGVTSTIFDLYEGTEDDCRTFISDNQLIYDRSCDQTGNYSNPVLQGTQILNGPVINTGNNNNSSTQVGSNQIGSSLSDKSLLWTVPRYFQCLNGFIADNRRVASTSIGTGIIQSMNLNISTGSQQWRFQIPYTDRPTNDVFLLVRDPVDRFLSAMVLRRLDDVDDTLTALANETQIGGCPCEINNDPHFYHQSWYIDMANGQNVWLYKFPDHIDNMAKDTGIGQTMPTENVTEIPKPSITDDQKNQVYQYYSDDYTLFQKITSPKQSGGN